MDKNREYENSLQEKEELISKITKKSDEQNKNILQSKEKIIIELRRELQ